MTDDNRRAVQLIAERLLAPQEGERRPSRRRVGGPGVGANLYRSVATSRVVPPHIGLTVDPESNRPQRALRDGRWSGGVKSYEPRIRLCWAQSHSQVWVE